MLTCLYKTFFLFFDTNTNHPLFLKPTLLNKLTKSKLAENIILSIIISTEIFNSKPTSDNTKHTWYVDNVEISETYFRSLNLHKKMSYSVEKFLISNNHSLDKLHGLQYCHCKKLILFKKKKKYWQKFSHPAILRVWPILLLTWRRSLYQVEKGENKCALTLLAIGLRGKSDWTCNLLKCCSCF